MEKRDLKISFYKAGTGKGARIILPIPWLRKLDITENEKDIELILGEENNQLIIKKRQKKLP